MTGDAAHQTILQAFLESYWADEEAGRVRELNEYLATFPGADEAIAREYLAIRAVPASAEREDDSSIGPYRIVRELGRGGQGAVYLAKDTRLGRQVALKILTVRGANSESMVLRFRREAEVASRLDHPGICGVIDAGVDEGVPWIAMRYVEGMTLADRIRKARHEPEGPHTIILDLSALTEEEHARTVDEAADRSSELTRAQVMEVVEIFEVLARALHVAHEAGVVHRDIKPGNIMVAADGSPVILDFGLARDDETELHTLTRTGDLFGTPAYMSPEQLTASQVTLDRRTDIWSLAATLYECLCLRRPFTGPTREALFQAIRTEEPADSRRFNPRVPKDLAVVLATGLEKDRDRRYQTALDLAEELRRVRELEPILARPRGPILRLRRWSQRNPKLAVALALLLLSIAGGLGVALVLLHSTQEALHGERLAREESDAVTEFLSDTLARVDPGLDGNDVRVREVLDRAVETVGERFASRPLVEARLRATMGIAYRSLGLLDRAEIQARRCVELLAGTSFGTRRAEGHRELALVLLLKSRYAEAAEQAQAALAILDGLPGDHRLNRAACLAIQASVHHNSGEFEQALSLQRRALATRRDILGASNPTVAESLLSLAATFDELGQHEDAIRLQREALVILESDRRHDDPSVISALAALQLYVGRKGDLVGAESLIRDALKRSQGVYPDDHPTIADMLWRLGNLLDQKGDFAAAEGPLREALAMRRKLLGADHRDTATAMCSLADIFRRKRDFENAEKLVSEALDVRRRVFGDVHVAVASTLQHQAGIARARGDDTSAERLLREALAMWKETMGNDDPHVGSCLTVLALVRQKAGDLDGAEDLFTQVLEFERRRCAGDDRLVARAMNNLGSLLFRKQERGRSEALLLDALAMRRRVLSPGHPELRESLGNVAFVWDRAGKHAKSEPLHREALKMARESLPDDHRTVTGIEYRLGKNLVGQEKWKDAARTLRKCLEGRERTLPQDDILLPATRSWLGESLAGNGDFAEAETLLLESQKALTDHPKASPTLKRQALDRLVALYEAWGKTAQAAQWRARIPGFR